MAIRIQCGKCGRGYPIKDAFAGRTIKCPNCAGLIAVPAAGSAPPPPPPNAQTRPTAARPTAASRPSPIPSPARPAPAASTARASAAPPSRPPSAASQTAAQAPRPRPPTAAMGTPKDSAAASAPRASTAPAARMPPPPPGATVCPGCGRALPGEDTICRECGYNVKLGRKLSLSAAVRAAVRGGRVRLASGVLGSKDEWAVEFRRRSRKALLLLTTIPPILGLIALLFVGWRSKVVVEGPSLEALRAGRVDEVRGAYAFDPARQPPEPIRDVEGFAPWYAGFPVELTLSPRRDIIFQPPGDKRLAGGGQTASAWFLPYFSPKGRDRARYRQPDVSRVLALMQRSGKGRYKDVWEGGEAKPPDGGLLVYRRANNPSRRGALKGALLDFGADHGEMEKTLYGYARRGGPAVTIKGELWFIAARAQDLRGPYAKALAERLDYLPVAPEDYSATPKGITNWFFMPVIVTGASQVAPVESRPK